MYIFYYRSGALEFETHVVCYTLTVEVIIQECGSGQTWQEVEIPSSSEEGKTYHVQLPPWDRDISEVVCDCPSYEFRGRCRHQAEALSSVCSWSELTGKKQTAVQKANRVCPECGERTTLITVVHVDVDGS